MLTSRPMGIAMYRSGKKAIARSAIAWSVCLKWAKNNAKKVMTKRESVTELLPKKDKTISTENKTIQLPWHCDVFTFANCKYSHTAIAESPAIKARAI